MAKHNYVCFSCRTVRRADPNEFDADAEGQSPRCQHCSEPMQWAGNQAEPPKRSDRKTWARWSNISRFAACDVRGWGFPYFMKMNSLLKGGRVVKEIISENPAERTWIEIVLNAGGHELHRLLRTSPCPPEKASFNLRYATFDRVDIDNHFDPDDSKVGNYICIPSISALDDFLKKQNLTLEDFDFESAVADYPG